MIGGFCIRKCKKCELLEENYGTEKCAYYCTLCEKPVTEINWNECPLKLATEKTESEEYFFIWFQLDGMFENYEKENGTKNNEMWKDKMAIVHMGDDGKNFTNEERLILSKVYEKIDYFNETEYKKNEKYYDIWVEEEYTVNEQTTPDSSSNYKSASSSSSYSSPYS